MCGIVGYITTDDDTRTISKERFFREGLYANALRGMDSTGIMSLTKDFHWSWQKQAVPASDFIRDAGFQKREIKSWCAVGHGRAATIGKITTDNAHPFNVDDIILVHNGTLRSTYYLDHQCPDMDVDSQVLTYNLAQVEPGAAHEVLSKLQGAYALVWFDIRDETVNFARNSERPFHMGVNTAEDMLVFSSDGFLLNFITQRLSDHTARPTAIWQLGTGTHLKYKKGNLVPEVTTVPNFTPAYTPRKTGMAPTFPDTGRTNTRDGNSFSGPKSVGRQLPRPGGKAAELGKVKINNEYRRIPHVHSEMVRDWYGLDHDIDMYFEPHDFIQWGMTDPSGMIYGQIYHPEWDCWFDARVEDVTKHTMGLYSDAPWTIRIVGVDHSDLVAPRGGCTFMARPVNYCWEGDDSAERSKQAEFIQTITDEMEEEEPAPTQIGLYPGPRDDITEEGFYTLTQDGCCQCAQPLYIEDADNITWVGEMSNQPLCFDCLEEATSRTVH
jgi:hypothetical protein